MGDEAIDINKYTGQLRLWCQSCNEEKMTSVRFDPDSVKVELGEEHEINVKMTGFRHCDSCGSQKVAIRYLTGTFTVDTKKE